MNRKISKFNDFCLKEKPFKDISKNIIISGEPRGGTTWLMQLIQEKSDCVIWEPLHNENLEKYNIRLAKEIGLIPYIPENENFDLGKVFFEELFSGELPYGLHENFRYGKPDLKLKKRLLIKLCRSNLLLPWLINEFPSIKPIYLIRHPLSVISSQFRHDAFDNVNNLFLDKKNASRRYSDIFEKHKKNIEKITCRESAMANWWCINNLLALKNDISSILTISYEKLYLQPELEEERISNHLKLDDFKFNKDRILSPSFTTKKGSGITSSKNQLENFKRHLSKKQIKIILDVVESYEITVYNDSLEPNYDKLGY